MRLFVAITSALLAELTLAFIALVESVVKITYNRPYVAICGNHQCSTR